MITAVRGADEHLAGPLADLVLAPEPRGDGRTLANWRVLAAAGARQLDRARLLEAHLDAAVILADLAAPAPTPGSLWGVWAAQAPGAVVEAHPAGDGWCLRGAKAWCSGADRCTHALVTAEAPDGPRLFAVDLAEPGVRPDGGTWRGVGMRGSGTAGVRFDDVPAVAVGTGEAYLERPRFWHSAIGVAAVWFGGAVGAAAPLRRRLATGRGDSHDAAHAGHVDASLAAAAEVLRAAAVAIDHPTAPSEPVAHARRRALRARATVEAAVETVLRSTGRATGPAPLALDEAHARHVADLTVYVRQSHAERDLAALGHLAADLDGETDAGVRL